MLVLLRVFVSIVWRPVHDRPQYETQDAGAPPVTAAELGQGLQNFPDMQFFQPTPRTRTFYRQCTSQN